MSELVREAIRHYHDLLTDRHAASTREALDRCGNRVLRPHFIASTQFDELRRTATLLNRALLVAADRLAKDSALRRKLGFAKYMDPLIQLDRDNGLPSTIARFDGFFDRSGVFRPIEFNAASGMDARLYETFPSLPIAEEFSKRYAFRQTHIPRRFCEELYVADGVGGKRPAVIAVPVTHKPAPRSKYSLLDWAETPRGRPFRVLETTLDELRHEGGRLFVEREERIDIDIVAPLWDDLAVWAGSTNKLFEALRGGSVRALLGVSRGLLMGYKHTFELLSNPEYASIFEPEVAEALAKHVPWTRVVRHTKTIYDGKEIDLLAFVAENRERFVLKASGGSQGVGVFLGKHCTDEVWRQALRRALTQQFIVQEMASCAVETFPFAAPDKPDGFVMAEAQPTCEPFIWNGSNADQALTRVSVTGNHTLGDGGYETVLWILEGTK